MRRYRKGQTWRVPTAAESAAHADAAEGHRRSPSRPQESARGSEMVVKTPIGGIPARDGNTIYSATCTRCVETSAANDQKTISDTDEAVTVFNFDTVAIDGEAYVRTALTATGIRYAGIRSSGHVVIQFSILYLAPYTDEISSPCEAVVAEVLSVSCNSSGVAVGDEVTVYDPSACWFNVPIEVLEGATGQAVLMQADEYGAVPDCVEQESASCWWLVQHLCCTEELYAE